MAKIVNISEIHPTLGFTEFDILDFRWPYCWHPLLLLEILENVMNCSP